MPRLTALALLLLLTGAAWLGFRAYRGDPRSLPDRIARAETPANSPAATAATSATVPIAPPSVEASAPFPDRSGPANLPDPATLRLWGEIERALMSASDVERDRAYDELLPALLAREPAAAGLLVENWEPGPVRDELLRRLTLAWTAVDADAAMKWVAKLPDPAERNRAASAACYQIAQADPAGAIEVAEHFDLGRNNGRIEHLAQRWAEENFPAALEWIGARPAGELRDQLLARLSFTRAQSDPAEAAGIVARLIPLGPVQDEAALAVLRQWALRDSTGASAWLDLFPPGALRERGRQELAQVRRVAAISTQ